MQYGLRNAVAQVEVEGAIVHVGSRYANGFVIQEGSGELDGRELVQVSNAAQAGRSLGHQRVVSAVSIPDTDGSASQQMSNECLTKAEGDDVAVIRIASHLRAA